MLKRVQAEDVRYWLERGCSSSSGNINARYGSPRWEYATVSAGEFVCCSMDGSSTIREVNGACISGSHDAFMMTYAEAVNQCAAQGMRLCRSVEELDLICGTGCHHDSTLAWTLQVEAETPIVYSICLRNTSFAGHNVSAVS